MRFPLWDEFSLDKSDPGVDSFILNYRDLLTPKQYAGTGRSTSKMLLGPFEAMTAAED